MKSNNIIKEIMELTNNGIVVNFDVIDQIENGHQKLDPTIPQKTYTVYVTPISSQHDWVDCQNFDDLERGLNWGIKEAHKYIYENNNETVNRKRGKI
jgi:hypothetical protein